ncbi:hypothetical protein BpHYR1_029774 [Brachionus plicatilis]|uniref:Uncharacterized protein n=1 Tax=Brachionus plicatilis TaxID=10195 RepID=A0A3M7T9L1_BRAPC|nr:hypothetical protein BpHYR1_029774 [Brachionus plicatilis]
MQLEAFAVVVPETAVVPETGVVAEGTGVVSVTKGGMDPGFAQRVFGAHVATLACTYIIRTTNSASNIFNIGFIATC